MSLNRFEWLKAVMQSHVSPAAKNVATTLAVQFANDDSHQINPSRDTLAHYLKVHRDTVKRAIRELKNTGWLMVLEGRGRGRSSGYRLISPGRIVAFSEAKKGAIPPSQKGDDLQPKAPEKGDDLHGKGGRSAPPYKRQEQSSEQRAGASRGWPCEQRAVVRPGTHQEAAWNEWLAAHGWPSVVDLRVKLEDGFGMPFSMPPNDQHGIQERITERFVSWASSQMIERREAIA